MREWNLAALTVVLIVSGAYGAPKTWEYSGSGTWRQVADSRQASTAPANDPTLDRVEALLQQGRNKDAENLALDWFKGHRSSPLTDRALMLMAQAMYQYGDRIKAYYYLDELLDEHPESTLYAAALQKQFDIADKYLKGYKMRWLGVPMFRADDEAVEMLYRIQQRSAGSPIAEKALLRTADYYFADRQYDLAEDAYAVFLQRFPRSPEIPRARLKQAFSSYAQFHGPRFEVAPAMDAREQMNTIIRMHPDIAERENLPSLVEEIDRALARKMYLTADFYRRTHEARAAAYTYTYLTRAYPNSDEARQAQAQLRKLPQWALNFPQPKVQAETGTHHEMLETQQVK